MLQATSLFPSRALPAHFRCAPHPYSAPDSQNLRARSCALFLLAPLVKPDQVSLGGHPFSHLQGTHPLHRQLRYPVMFNVKVGLDVRGRPPHRVVRGVVEWLPASCDVKMKRPSGGPRVPLSVSCNASEEAGQSVSHQHTLTSTITPTAGSAKS